MKPSLLLLPSRRPRLTPTSSLNNFMLSGKIHPKCWLGAFYFFVLIKLRKVFILSHEMVPLPA